VDGVAAEDMVSVAAEPERRVAAELVGAVSAEDVAPVAAAHERPVAAGSAGRVAAGLVPLGAGEHVSAVAAERALLVAAVCRGDVVRRARRVGAVARLRFGGDPFRRDHAHARAALALTGQLDAVALGCFAGDAQRAAAGVPCSEPGWVRPLDAVLAAAALHRAGDREALARLRTLLTTRFPLRRGHRAAWWWTILGVGGGACPSWEHAAATGVARAFGAVGTGDWDALRKPALGAAARGTSDPHDERLIAAGRVWLAQVDDPAAAAILARPTVRHDPLAVALDRLAHRLQADSRALRQSALGPDPTSGAAGTAEATIGVLGRPPVV
jgi:hypothetical protein